MPPHGANNHRQTSQSRAHSLYCMGCVYDNWQQWPPRQILSGGISWWRIIYFLCPLHHYECLNENYSLVKEESSHLWQNLLTCSLLTDCSSFVCSQRSKQDKVIDLHEICCRWYCRCCRWFNKQATLRSVVPLSVLSSLSKVLFSCLFCNLVDRREVHGTQLGKELLLFSSASQNFFFWGLKCK